MKKSSPKPAYQDDPSVSRRSFISTTSLGLAALSGSRVSMAQATDRRQRIRIGMVGCGGRGQWLLGLFEEHGGYEIAGVADFFSDRAEEAAARFGLSPDRVFTGLHCAEELAGSGGLDAMAVISPPYFHPSQVATAVQVGLHVYLAKPVAVDAPGCRSIQESGELARHKNLTFLVDFQTRTNEYYIEAVRRIHSGDHGEIVYGESRYHSGRLDAKAVPGSPGSRLRNWVFDIPLSGDIVVEQNIHTLDVMSWVMRDLPPLKCTGTCGRKVRTDVGDTNDNFALVYEYPNDVGITFSSRQFNAYGEPGGITNRFFATEGVFSSKYGGEVYIRGDAERFYRGGNTASIYRDGAVSNIATFHRSITDGDSSNPTFEPSVMSNYVAIMGRMAAYTGRTISWDEIKSSNEMLGVDPCEL